MSDASYAVTEQNRVRRVPHRGHYDRATIHRLLDAAQVASVGFVDDGKPVVIPMMVARDGDDVLIHGARKGRITESLTGAPVCITVTFVDGLVYARSIFHSSMNYRSAVLHGTARAIDDPDEKLAALRIFSEHLMPGRWDEVRAPLAKELKATQVMRVAVASAAAKIRAAGVLDDEADYSADDWANTWAGIVPIVSGFGQPLTDAAVPDTVATPASVAWLAGAKYGAR